MRLDVAALAASGGELGGQWQARDLPRLSATQSAPDDLVLAPIQWRLRGHSRPVTGAPAQTWLHLEASTEVWLTCQRCLQAFCLPLAPAVDLQFVRGEDRAAELDAEVEHDVLALGAAIDARELVEDELLLAVPLVPRHEHCPAPLPHSAAGGPEPTPAAQPSPFAALAGLKRGPK
jgi:uncharacterized protein